MPFDLLIRGGRVIDPATGQDGTADLGVTGGRITASQPGLPDDNARAVIDAGGCLVTPGLIDLHAHVYWGGTSLGVDPDAMAAPSGVTTFVDAGSAGAGNFMGFRAHVIAPSRVRVLAFVNIAFPGIFGFSGRVMVGECGIPALLDPVEAAACLAEHADIAIGVKVRTGAIAGAGTDILPLVRAIETAERAGLPVMAHIDKPPPGRAAVLERLRRGDVLTHCYRPAPNAPTDEEGRVLAEMEAARARGVLFDIGHGMGSFSFDVARAMLAQGFPPDVISSDLHLFCANGPAFDLAVCLSKFRALGLGLMETIAAATTRPAEWLGRPELGTLAAGTPADIALFREEPGEVTLTDSTGRAETGTARLVPQGIVAGGRWIANPAAEGPRDLSMPAAPETRTQTEIARARFGRPWEGSG